jgi:DNA-binding GntR family transcriptional regulator
MPLIRDAPLDRRLLRDDVYERLRDAIVAGTLAPGEQLRDLELAEQLGVSRTPIREAMLRLGRAGLVDTAPGRSTVVAPVEAKAVADAQAVVAAMHALTVQQAVPRLGADDLARMRRANETFARAVDAGDVDAALAADDDFHLITVRLADNQAAAAVIEQFEPVLRRSERLRFAGLAARDSVLRHDELIARCERGDAEGAAATARQIWQSLTSHPSPSFDPAGAAPS